MVAITRDAMGGLRNALITDLGYAAAAGYLQQAGYAGGGALFEAFRGWLAARDEGSPEDLSVTDFQSSATNFFSACGWGSLVVGDLHDTVATLDTDDWGEATPDSQLDQASCHFTAGMFSDFFGRLSDAPLAVMEVECRSTGAERCRFLLGSTEVIEHVYNAMSSGESYEAAVGAAA